MDVVPIRVKIGLKPNGHADYPAWENLPIIAAGLPAGNPTRARIDEEINKHWHPVKWLYDKVSGHEDDTPGGAFASPQGQQWGMLLVSRQFADQAISAFPALVTEMTQAQCQNFWNNRAMVRLRDEDDDLDALNALKVRRDLLLSLPDSPQRTTRLEALDTRIANALDPDSDEPGVKKNHRRRFADAATRFSITFHSSVAP